MSQTLARRARIKDLSNKAEGIFQYVGNDNVLFRLISTGNKLTSDVNYAVALFTGFARSHQLGSQETRRTIDSIYRRVGELMCLIDIVHAAAGEEIMPEKNQTPIEMLNQNAAVVQSIEVPAPVAPTAPAQSPRQSYAEKVQGLTVDERNWMLAKSKAAAMAQLPEGFLPQTYTGNPGACAIACEMALRMGVSHLFVMQNLYVVHGMPTWSGKSCKALIDNSGQFAGRTRYRMEGEEGTDNWGCRLIGVDKLTGEKVEGPKVTHGQDGKGCRVVEQEWQLLAQNDRNDAQVPRRRLLCPRRVSGGPDGRQHRLRGRRWRRRGRGCGPCLMLLR